MSPQKQAHNRVAIALAQGWLTKESCGECGSVEVQAHHPDYDKPYLVEWLCRSHHMARTHRNYGALGYSLIKISPEVDQELRRLKREWELQSHNKVLKRLLGITKEQELEPSRKP